MVLLAAAAAIMISGSRPAGPEPASEGNGTVSSTFSGKVDYDTYFTGERLRIDLTFAGNATSQNAYLNGLACEARWAGSPASLIDPFGYGNYYYEAFADGKLIYSNGFSTLFQEWTTTDEAKHVSKSMSQTIWMPFPKQSIHIVLYERKYEDILFHRMFEFDVDPTDKLIRRGAENSFAVEDLQVSGDMAHKVDILFVAEGYTAQEMDKFRDDARKFTEYLFSMAPYDKRRNDFNVRLLLSVSDESGVDIPHKDIWKRTVCNSNFYTFRTDRYLTIEDHSRIASTVSGAPFDALFVIANGKKYGGGGIYNSYAMGTADNSLSNQVFIHEFGHSFAGLGDEYFNSSVAYEDFYNLKTEPWEPNITTLVNFEAKWKDMLPADAVIPTMPNDTSMKNTLGVYEGGGYMVHGVYRPYIYCRMRNNTCDGFCPVCQRAINKMIDFYAR